MNSGPIILFDGICNFCNAAVNFVIKRDKNKLIKFAALQTDAGQQILRQFNLPAGTFNSFLLIEEGRVYTMSTAALKVCKYLTALWPLAHGFIIVPKSMRDGIYKLLAKNRYKWFGKRQQCMIPTLDLSDRFLQ